MQISVQWLAGFFDGEGTFYIGTQFKKGKVYPHCSILLAQSGDIGLNVFTKIQETYGGKIYEHLKAGQHKATKSAYKMYWNKQEAIPLLKNIIPHLIIKQQAAQACLEYLERNNKND